MLNNITLHGRIGAINSYKVFTNQQTGEQRPSMILSLAVDRNYKNQQGQHPTDWFSVIISRGVATFLHQVAKPGDHLIVSGPIYQHPYQDQNGNNVREYQIHAFSVDLISHQNNGGQPSNNPNMQNQGQNPNANPNFNPNNQPNNNFQGGNQFNQSNNNQFNGNGGNNRQSMNNNQSRPNNNNNKTNGSTKNPFSNGGNNKIDVTKKGQNLPF